MRRAGRACQFYFYSPSVRASIDINKYQYINNNNRFHVAPCQFLAYNRRRAETRALTRAEDKQARISRSRRRGVASFAMPK